MAEVRTEVTEYVVTAWPEDLADVPESVHGCVTVADRGRGMWAVLEGRGGSMCLGRDGEFDWEPSPSNRTDEWLASHRFTLDEALALAREQALRITINGYTTQQAAGRWREARASRA